MDVLSGLASIVTRTPWICREPTSAKAYGNSWKSRVRVKVVSRANAVAIASRSVPLRLLVCGDGPDRANVEEWVRAANLTERVRLTGHVDNVWSSMKAADWFVSVSTFERRSNAVMEAMAYGCLLLVSNIPAHREFLTSETSRFANERDPEAIASAIVDGLTDPLAAGTRAMAAAQQWSVSKMAQGYERVYTTSLASR